MAGEFPHVVATWGGEPRWAIWRLSLFHSTLLRATAIEYFRAICPRTFSLFFSTSVRIDGYMSGYKRAIGRGPQ
jgi:hypothetical protein